ncbi:MAG TPA: molecular chaperone DnaJ [Mycobacteriales bacterium]|nr:molecular chaperone DnaJ [Mycobacteriales bacterium]
MAIDLYGILGLGKDATPEEIKRSYRKLVRELHPDVNPDEEERFKEVTAAYDVLSDPEKRQRYDMGGSDGFGGFEGGGFGGLQDIMDAFFGGGGGFSFGGGSRGPRSRVRRGEDLLVGASLSMAETAFGVTREITVDTAVACTACRGEGTAEGTAAESCTTCRGRGEVNQVARSFLGQVMTTRPCPACGGAGSVITHPCAACSGEGRRRERRTLTVKIPAGVEHGMRIKLTGEGAAGPGGGPPGDLYVEVDELDHEVFERDGDDLHCKVTLPMTAAALGTSVDLLLLEGETEQVDVRAGTQSGSVITLRGRGVPHVRSAGRGHLHVHVEVTTPTDLDAEQERLLRELAALRGEERSEGGGGGGGLFGRLRDVITGR